MGDPGRFKGVLVSKRWLIAAALVLMPAAGHAQIVCANCTEELTAQANNVVVAANWVTQLERMTAQVTQQINIFQSLSGLTNVNAMAAVLNQAGNFNQFASFGNVAQQLMGAGGGIGVGYQAANGNELPVGSVMPLMAANAAVFNARAGSLATVQGISTQLLTNSNVILAGLRALQGLIDGQPTSQLMSGMTARLAAYQGNINSQQYQLSQMRAFANAQDKVFEQKQQLASYCSDYAWANATKSLTGAGLNLGAAHCTGNAGVATAPVVANAPAAPAVAGTAGFDTPTTTAANALPVPPIPVDPS